MLRHQPVRRVARTALIPIGLVLYTVFAVAVMLGVFHLAGF